MKRLCFAILLIAGGIILPAKGQSPLTGVQFSGNLAELHGSGVPRNADPKPGLTAGVFANIPFNKFFSLETELLYANKGTRFDQGPSDYSIKIDYMELPFLAQVGFGKKEKLRFYGNAGPYFGLLLSARREGSIAGRINPFTQKRTVEQVNEDIQRDLSRWDFGLAGSMGVHFPFYNGRMKIALRYSQSLPQIQASDDAEMLLNQQNGPIKNGVMMLSVGYGLTLTQ